MTPLTKYDVEAIVQNVLENTKDLEAKIETIGDKVRYVVLNMTESPIGERAFVLERHKHEWMLMHEKYIKDVEATKKYIKAMEMALKVQVELNNNENE